MKNILQNNSKEAIVAYVELGMFCLLICMVLFKMILHRLKRLFININNGDTPFTLENVKYIKQMTYLMIFAIISLTVKDLHLKEY